VTAPKHLPVHVTDELKNDCRCCKKHRTFTHLKSAETEETMLGVTWWRQNVAIENVVYIPAERLLCFPQF
jgi:hypothetical protein